MTKYYIVAAALALAVMGAPVLAQTSSTTVTTPSGLNHGSMVNGNLPDATGYNTLGDSSIPTAVAAEITSTPATAITANTTLTASQLMAHRQWPCAPASGTITITLPAGTTITAAMEFEFSFQGAAGSVCIIQLHSGDTWRGGNAWAMNTPSGQAIDMLAQGTSTWGF